MLRHDGVSMAGSHPPRPVKGAFCHEVSHVGGDLQLLARAHLRGHRDRGFLRLVLRLGAAGPQLWRGSRRLDRARSSRNGLGRMGAALHRHARIRYRHAAGLRVVDDGTLGCADRGRGGRRGAPDLATTNIDCTPALMRRNRRLRHLGNALRGHGRDAHGSAHRLEHRTRRLLGVARDRRRDRGARGRRANRPRAPLPTSRRLALGRCIADGRHHRGYALLRDECGRLRRGRPLPQRHEHAARQRPRPRHRASLAGRSRVHADRLDHPSAGAAAAETHGCGARTCAERAHVPGIPRRADRFTQSHLSRQCVAQAAHRAARQPGSAVRRPRRFQDDQRLAGPSRRRRIPALGRARDARERARPRHRGTLRRRRVRDRAARVWRARQPDFDLREDPRTRVAARAGQRAHGHSDAEHRHRCGARRRRGRGHAAAQRRRGDVHRQGIRQVRLPVLRTQHAHGRA